MSTPELPPLSEIKAALALYKSFQAVIAAMMPEATKAATAAHQMQRMMNDFMKRSDEALANYKKLLRARKKMIEVKGAAPAAEHTEGEGR